MDKSKLVLAISILLGFIILGLFVYASEISRQHFTIEQERTKQLNEIFKR